MHPLKTAIATQVRSIFADRAGRVTVIERSNDALFAPGSVIWRVHADVTTMMIGGVSALLMQMLHPAALAGIWDHSNFRHDMSGRLRRTSVFIAQTTYGARDAAEAAIARVRRIHEGVRGLTATGEPYHANDPALLAFVHVAEASGFLRAFVRYRDPRMSRATQDRYYAEIAEIGHRLGAVDLPVTAPAVEAYLRRSRTALRADARSREAARLLLDQPPPSPALMPFQAITMQAAIDLMPDWARAMHGLPMPLARRPLVRAGALGLAETLRWAFARPATA